jgi:polysaccharide biosynthesis transport protein
MQNQNFNPRNYVRGYSKSMKDYILLVRTNLKPFILIAFSIFIISSVYAFLAPSIYRSTVTLKITKSQQNLLETVSQPEASEMSSDRFIANEIEVMQSFGTREIVAKALIDSIENSQNKIIYKLFGLKRNEIGINGHKTVNDIAGLLKGAVNIDQEPGMDIVDISAESQSPKEAVLIANTYADKYKELNLQESRNQLTTVRAFLEKQSQEKLAELNNAENELANFKERGGIVALDAQSAALITQLSQLDAQRDATKIDMMTSNEVLNQYKNEINDQDPQLVNYLENQTSQAYIDVLQKQIADLQMNRDMVMANKSPDTDVTATVKDYDRKIDDLKQKLNAKINEIKTGAFSSSPEQIKNLTQKLIEEEVKNRSLSIKLNELQTLIANYEESLSKLPKKSMQFAGYERNLESLQQLYTVIEQKYQEALVNELSRPGDVFIIGEGTAPDKPAKPMRVLIVLIGLLAGFGVAFGYVIIQDYFDDTIKSPDDILKKDLKLLSWVPRLKIDKKFGLHKNDMIVLEEPHSAASEAFKVLRARIQLTTIQDRPVKTILISSGWQGEGKTMVAVNIAYCLAQLKKRVLLIDCDLRRPRIHKIMGTSKTPGLVDYIMDKVSLQSTIQNTKLEHLAFISSGAIDINSNEIFDLLKATKSNLKSIKFEDSGTTTLDTTELLASQEMENFLLEMKNHYDYIIIDSAPLISVIDSELLARYADGIILVVSSYITENKIMNEAIELIKKINISFLGIVLNNFQYKNGYKYYFKYYYNYSKEDKKERNKENVEKRKGGNIVEDTKRVMKNMNDSIRQLGNKNNVK